MLQGFGEGSNAEPHLAVHLDQALHADGVHLSARERVLEAVTQHQHQRQALALLVRPGGWLGSEHARQLIKHPVLGGTASHPPHPHRVARQRAPRERWRRNWVCERPAVSTVSPCARTPEWARTSAASCASWDRAPWCLTVRGKRTRKRISPVFRDTARPRCFGETTSCREAILLTHSQREQSRTWPWITAHASQRYRES
jgi:hypothetical protein